MSDLRRKNARGQGKEERRPPPSSEMNESEKKGNSMAIMAIHWISDIVSTIGQGQNSHNIQYITISNSSNVTMR